MLTQRSSRPPARRGRVAVLLLAVALSIACNKGPAQEAIAAVEQALAAAPQLAAHEPEQLAAIEQALRDARVSFGEGRYTDALRAAQPLPDRVAAAAQSAARRKQQAEAAWRALAAELPGRLEPLQARIAALQASGMAPERLAPAQAELAALSQSLAEAQVAFERGELAKALAAGRDVMARAESLAGRLGLKATPPPLPSPRATPTAPPS